jgi:predicted RNA binding protein YcfA (HicA-like mRNA interferase family)
MPGRARVQVSLCFGARDRNSTNGAGPLDQPHIRCCTEGNSKGGRTRMFTLDLNSADVYVIHTMQSREIIDSLTADGWRKVAQKGSHVQFKHPTKPGRVTVPHPKRDIPIGTLRSIEKQSGLKLTR